MSFFREGYLVLCVGLFTGILAAQQSDPQQPAAREDKRAYGVLPNYRTVENSPNVEPLTAKKKFTIAAKDSFDYPVYFLSGVFSGISQLENQNPSFGQGLKGYGKRYGGAFGDQCIGNMMTEGLFPSFLHEDPRYYRIGSGSTLHRIGYAATRIFVVHTDSGRQRFNFSEVLGNSTATAISNLYYPETRNVRDNLQKLGLQLGTDALSQVLKEFWPDVKRRLAERHKAQP